VSNEEKEFEEGEVKLTSLVLLPMMVNLVLEDDRNRQRCMMPLLQAEAFSNTKFLLTACGLADKFFNHRFHGTFHSALHGTGVRVHANDDPSRYPANDPLNFDRSQSPRQ